MKEIFLTRVFVPRNDNTGSPFPRRMFVQTERTLLLKFQGLTMWGNVRGQWVSPSGQVDTDSHHVYEIAHSGREIPWWRRFKRKLRKEYRQEDVWIIQSAAGWHLF